MTRSFNAAAISSPLMSSEGGAGPHPRSSESEAEREEGREDERRFSEKEVHSIQTTMVVQCLFLMLSPGKWQKCLCCAKQQQQRQPASRQHTDGTGPDSLFICIYCI